VLTENSLFLSSLFYYKKQSRLPPEVNRILYVRNLPFKITAEELYAIFGKYGAVFQIRLGDKSKDTRGTAFVVYEDIYDAKAAVDHLSGFNVGGRYLVVLYYQPAKFQRRAEASQQKEELEELRRQVKAKKAAIAKSED
jgi:pre-mRNA branch site protein p14